MKRLIKMWDGTKHTTKSQKDTVKFLDKNRWKIESMERIAEKDDKEQLLIDYMNEYMEREDLVLTQDFEFDDGTKDRFFHSNEWDFTIEQEQMISKRFWFIHWLVENWHIDKDAMREKVMRYCIASLRPLEDDFIMYLAIHDDPIEELIACLK